MKIRYVTGRSGTGKSHLVLREIREKIIKDNNGKLILLVPEQFTLQSERDLIYKMELPGIIDVNVLSFTRLAHKVFNEVGGLTRIHLNEQGKNILLRKIIDESEKSLSIYKKAAHQEGFVAMFSDLISELKQQDISPAQLKEQLGLMEYAELLTEKMKDIITIYEGFNRYIDGRYIDAEDYLNVLIEKMGDATFLKDAEIWIDGFTTFTPQTYQILERLISMAKQVTFTFTMAFSRQERDGDLFEISEKTYERIHDLAFRIGMPGEIIDLDKEPIKSAVKAFEIKHLEQEIFAYPYNVFKEKVNNINLFAGMNYHSEVEHVAAKMVSLVRDSGYRWKDIALICNDMDSYGMLIKRVFQEYGIPCFLDKKRSIMHNPIVEMVLSSLTVIQKWYRYEDIFRYFKTGFSGIDVDTYEQLENYVLQYGIRGNGWKEPFKYGDDELLGVLNTTREKIMEPLMKLEKKIKNKNTIGEITRALFEFLYQLKVPELLEAWIDELRIKGFYEYVSENTQIWNILLDILDQLVEILGDQTVTLKAYIRMLEAGLSSIELAIIPTTIDQVLVGTIQRSKSHDIKALFVIGVNDGVLPSKKEEDRILSDEERALLKSKGIELGFDRESNTYLEKYNIYSVFSKPTDYFWMSYALADQEGRALRPSILLDRFKKLFSGIKIFSDVMGDLSDLLISTPGSTFKYCVEKLRMEVDGKSMEELWWGVYQWYYENKDWNMKRTAIIEGLFHKNQISYIEESHAQKLYRLPIRSSVSRLEQFINCPFAHFIRYGLRPTEREVYKIQAPDLGDIFHRSMEEFTLRLKEEQLDWRALEREKCHSMADDVIDMVVLNHRNGIMDSTHRYKYLTNRLKRISRRALWTLTEHIKKSGFNPVEYEVAFGLNHPYPPIEVELGDGEKIYLEGRIDRVDILDGEEHNFVKIIDYKSGDKDFSLSDVYHGLQLQLMIYLDAILSNGEKINGKSMKPAGVFYFKVDDPMVKTEEKLIEEIEKEIQKRLKMKGLVLKDINIVKEMDREISGYSHIIPVGINKDNGFYSNSSIVDDEEFYGLIDYVKKLVKEITKEMLKGRVCIEPIKSGNQVACTYCSYKAICQFDTMFEDNAYRYVKKLTDEEVLEKVGSRGGETVNGKVD